MKIPSLGTLLIFFVASVTYILVSSTCLCCHGYADMYTGHLTKDCPWYVAIDIGKGGYIRTDAIMASLKVFVVGMIIKEFAIPIIRTKFFPIYK